METELCIIGDLCADLLLPYGETKQNLRRLKQGIVETSEVVFRQGGTCGNTSVILGRLGEHPHFVTELCSDRIGQFLKQEMEDNGVLMDWSLTNPDKSNMLCIAVIDEDNERTMFSWLPPGSDYPKFSEENLSLIPENEPMLVFTGGMVMNNDPSSMNAVTDKIQQLKQTGSTVVFDLNVRAESYGMNAERRHAYERMIGLSDIIIGSGPEEFSAVTGIVNLEQAADHLAASGHTVIARNGRKPVYVTDGTNSSYVPTDAVSVQQTLGAGDTFNGAFLFALNRGLHVRQAVKFANGIAAYMIASAGHLSVPKDIEERLSAAASQY